MYNIIFALSLLAAFKAVPILLSPGVFNDEVGGTRVTLGEWIDIGLSGVLTVAWMYYVLASLLRQQPSEKELWRRPVMVGLFVVSAALFMEGHGTHAAANAISRLTPEGSQAYALAYFFDERLSHVLSHLGLMGMAVSTMALQVNRPYAQGASRLQATLLLVAAAAFGVALARGSVEGQTAPLILFLSIVLLLAFGREAAVRQLNLAAHPVLLFFLAALFTSGVLLSAWGLWHWGFPELSELGWWRGPDMSAFQVGAGEFPPPT